MNLWPIEIAAWREQHLRSDCHALIMTLAEIESFIHQQFGIDPTVCEVPKELQQFAWASLCHRFVDNEEQADKLRAAMAKAAEQFRQKAN